MMRRSTFFAGAASLALGLIALQSAARAALVSVPAAAQFSSNPISFTLGTGTFSFTLDPSGYQSDVMTSGSGMVTSLFGSVDDLEVGSVVNGDPGNLYTFASFSSPSLIGSSAADDYIGFSYLDAASATHYGYAEVFGKTFVGYAYQTTAGAAVTTAPVPEPTTAALLAGGLAAIGFARRVKRSRKTELTA